MGCSSSKQKNNCDLCNDILGESYYECFESIFGINNTLLDFLN